MLAGCTTAPKDFLRCSVRGNEEGCYSILRAVYFLDNKAVSVGSYFLSLTTFSLSLLNKTSSLPGLVAVVEKGGDGVAQNTLTLCYLFVVDCFRIFTNAENDVP